MRSPWTARAGGARATAPPAHRASRGVLATVAVALVAGTALAGEAVRAAPEAGKLGLVIEHVPPLVYAGERVPVCLRVENRGEAEVSCSVEVALWPERSAEGSGVSPATRTLAVPASGSAQAAFELPSSGWERAQVLLGRRDSPLELVEILRFDGDGAVPPLEAFGDRLRPRPPAEETGAPPGGSSPAPRRRLGASAGPDLLPGRLGELAVVCLPMRTPQPDREWYLWKRLAERIEEGSTPAGVLLLAPAFGARRKAHSAPEPGASGRPWQGPEPDEPAYFRLVRERAGTRVEAVALPGESAEGVLHPVLADLATALEAIDSARRRAELVVWVVACDDARRATPLRLFRKAVELVLMRARGRGASRAAILFLPEPAVEPARRELYAEELAQAASAYRASFARLDALEKTECWVAGSPSDSPRARTALGRYPNSRGEEALAEAILSRVRP